MVIFYKKKLYLLLNIKNIEYKILLWAFIFLFIFYFRWDTSPLYCIDGETEKKLLETAKHINPSVTGTCLTLVTAHLPHPCGKACELLDPHLASNRETNLRYKTMIKLFKSLPKIITWISVVFYKDTDFMPTHSLIKLVKDLSINTRGDGFTLLFVKSIRCNLANYLSGNPARDPLSSCTKDGIPIILGDLIPWVRRKSYVVISMIYSILYSTSSLKLGTKPDYASITMSYKGSYSNESLFMGSFWRELGYHQALQKPKRLDANLRQLRSRYGPYGQALWTSLVDAHTIPFSRRHLLIKLGGAVRRSDARWIQRESPGLLNICLRTCP